MLQARRGLLGLLAILLILCLTVFVPSYFKNWRKVANVDVTRQHTYTGVGRLQQTDSLAEPAGDPGIENPGCRVRELAAYRPVKVGREYRHPLIVHYAKFHRTPNGKFSITFLEYLSILSVHKFLRPEKIMIHSNARFEGKYWSFIQRWTNKTVMVNAMERVTHFGKQQMSFIEHMADYAKLSQVLKHGGIAMDLDVIFINSTKLREAQKFSECVLVKEEGAIRISFFSCVKNARFIKTMVESYHKDYQPGWVYNAGHVPTMLLADKKRSECFNVFVDTTICSPTFGLARELWLKPFGVDWRTKIAAHYYRRKLLLPWEDEYLLEGNSSLSDLLRNVYRPSQYT